MPKLAVFSESDEVLPEGSNAAEVVIGIAAMIGIDIVNEPQFLWIAEEASRAQIPPDWKELTNEDGETLYYHTQERKLQKVHPLILRYQEAGEDRCFTWQGDTKVKSLTDISVVCQKGQKHQFDPTPNQDNFFVNHVGAVTMYGVFDGHGPFGHLISLRLVQSMPYHISKSEHYGKDWELTLKDAFLESQRELEEFCKKENVNIEASGAAGSVLVLEEQTIHIAFIGDARVALGSWNRRDSRMIFCSRDHKPDLPEEKARLEAAGSEVREIEPGNCRIYRPGTNFPGLTMSRAFGDTACEGVLREPEYHKFLMQPADQWYAIIGSDGIWEFIDGEEACNLSSKKLRLKGPRETNHFLLSASRKRWAHVCKDYCDDITSILVQWNSADPPKDANCNHQLTVSVQEGVAELNDSALT